MNNQPKQHQKSEPVIDFLNEQLKRENDPLAIDEGIPMQVAIFLNDLAAVRFDLPKVTQAAA